ncbi:MAG: hypothetical protein JNJ78_06945 [Anaerolineae bacterium]|nr:hypothetical protein [Anaerolineae bacterium]
MTRLSAPLQFTFLLLLTFTISACGASARQIIPTGRPTATHTLTPTATRTPGFDATPTATSRAALAGPSPTSIFGPTSTSVALLTTPTRVINPNAPRIEFFTTDVLNVAPGAQLTLFWSVRGARNAIIYRLDSAGTRSNLWNVPPDGNLVVTTSRRERGQVSFLLVAGEGELETSQLLSVPLLCPDPWFFQPAPEACPAGPAEATTVIEEPFERGRVLYIQSRNRVYTLFNDGRAPAWLSFENRYNPAIHPESEESFVPPPGLVQPLRIIGFVWRGNDTVRNRLGLGVQAETTYDGFVQTIVTGTDEQIYVSSADGTVLHLIPGGDIWEIITPPSS